MSYIPCVQGSPEWLQERCGRITASRIVDVLAVLKKGGESAARAAYRMELVAERLTGRSAQHFVSNEMLGGIENEVLARGAYEVETDNSVDLVGFYTHPEMDFAGASPDGVIGGEGCIEIKCPKTSTHIGWMLAGVIPPEHVPQMAFEMACTGRKWCDFVSFDPRLPVHLQLFIRRMERDDESITDIEAAVCQMDAEVDAILNRLTKPVLVTPPDPILTNTFLTDEDFAGLIPTAKETE